MPRRTLASLAAGAALLAPVLAGRPRPASATHPLRYVALGGTPTARPRASCHLIRAVRCARARPATPHVIAGRIGASLTDVTCGAAQTKDFFTGQYPGVAPQLDAVHRHTQLVTMTIGGNDNNTFISAIAECGAAGLSTLGTGSPCQDRYGGSFVHDIRHTTYPALVRSLKAVRHRAPQATVAILGSRGSCRRPTAASSRCRWR